MEKPFEKRRLFVGFEASAPWPIQLPHGKITPPEMRHLTLVYLGMWDAEPLLERIDQMPLPPFSGLDALLHDCLFLSNVVAYAVDPFDQPLAAYQNTLAEWLGRVEDRPYLPHVTLCRHPEDKRAWKKALPQLPAIFSSLHLYESLGNSTYKPLWSHQLSPPWEKLDATSDTAFRIHGPTLATLYRRAQLALAWECPGILGWFDRERKPSTHDELVYFLNELLARAGKEIEIPYKAVASVGDLQQKGKTLTWVMSVEEQKKT